jgi:hypothetical protein
MGSKRIGLARVEKMLESLKREIDWGTTTFTGTGTGAITAARKANTAAFVQNSDSVVSWTQPANTALINIYLAVTTAPVTAASAELGFEVGTTSGGGEIVTQMPDEIIDVGADGTDLAVGAVLHIAGRGNAADGSGGPVLNAFNSATTDATTLAADGTYTASSRTLYLNTVTSNHAVTTAGTVVWVLEYMKLA